MWLVGVRICYNWSAQHGRYPIGLSSQWVESTYLWICVHVLMLEMFQNSQKSYITAGCEWRSAVPAKHHWCSWQFPGRLSDILYAQPSPIHDFMTLKHSWVSPVKHCSKMFWPDGTAHTIYRNRWWSRDMLWGHTLWTTRCQPHNMQQGGLIKKVMSLLAPFEKTLKRVLVPQQQQPQTSFQQSLNLNSINRHRTWSGHWKKNHIAGGGSAILKRSHYFIL